MAEEKADIRWDQNGLVPAIVQDANTNQVLMLAYMDQTALDRVLETGESWFWSRSRGELWHKGATSGHTQQVVEIRYDCDGDALLLRVIPAGPACHTGHPTCFYRSLTPPPSSDERPPSEGILSRLEAVIHERQAHPRPGSYTCRLLEAGLPTLLKKVGEEAIEVIVAAQNETDERMISELADLVYHTLVLLAARGLSWADVEAELARRFG